MQIICSLKLSNYILIFSFLFSTACSPGYDQDFYERVSGISIPGKKTVIESFDNGEYLTISSFRLTKSDMKKFLHAYNFKKLPSEMNLELLGGRKELREILPEDRNRENYFYISGQKAKTTWLYIADTALCTLWAEIQYPDFAGN